jgi:concentrative nucleoside transporter, CNT family
MNRRVRHANKTVRASSYPSRASSGHDFWLCHYIRIGRRGVHLTRPQPTSDGIVLHHVHTSITGSQQASLPRNRKTLTAGRVVVPDDDEHRASNALHAFANGAWLGLKIAGMIIATLVCIIALLGLIDGLLTWWGHYLNINDPPLTLQLLLGYICYPVAFLLGVPRTGDLLKVAQLIGVKIVANEFVAYNSLTSDPAYISMSPRSRLIATYALCGFANFGSLGTQIGVLSQIAPGRAGDVSQVALSALFSGALSTLTSASIAGMLVTDQRTYTQSS